MKKRLSILIALAMLCTLFTALPASAELSTTEIDGETYYQIGTAADYAEFVTMANADLTINAILTADINLTGWTGVVIGKYAGKRADSLSYSGTFDGQGHIIKNLNISRTFSKAADNGFAMFSSADGATIKNLGLENAHIENKGANGGVVLGGIAGMAYATTIENCYVKNSEIVSTKQNYYINYAAPIAGYIGADAAVKNCYSTGNTIGFTASGGSFGSNGVAVSAFVGSVSAATAPTPEEADAATAAKITNCYARNNTLLNLPSGQKSAGFARLGSSGKTTTAWLNSYTDKKTNFDAGTLMNYYAASAAEWSDGTVLAGINGDSAFKADTYGLNGYAPRLAWESNVIPFNITVTAPQNGTVTAPVSAAVEGSTVTLTVTPDRGYAVDWVKVNGVEISAPYSFTMPSEAVTVTAQFKVPWSGSGTQGDPYKISTADDLKALARATNGSGLANENMHYEDTYFELENDIDMQGVEYTPIATIQEDKYLVNGTNERSFGGIFDGKGHVIRNLTVNTSHRGPALFGSLNGATITDLGIENSTFRQQKNYRAATLATYAYSSIISGCFAKNCTVNLKSVNDSNETANSQEAGGLVARLYGTSSVSNCYTRGITLGIETSGVGFNASAGGFAGYVGSAVTITDCYTAEISFVTVNTSGNVANFARFYSTPAANVTNCHTDVKRPRDNEEGLPQVTIISTDVTWTVEAFYGKTEDDNEKNVETNRLRFMARPTITRDPSAQFATSNYGFVFTNFDAWTAEPANPYSSSSDLPANAANSIKSVNVSNGTGYLQSGGTFYYDITGIPTNTKYTVNMYAVPYVLRDSKIIAWGTPFTYTKNNGELN